MPRKGSSAGRSAGVSVGIGAGRGGVRYEWNGTRGVDFIDTILLAGMQKLAKTAKEYWDAQEWTSSNHPYMTGEERDSGYFIVSVTGSHRVVLVFGARAPHAFYEEFGHGQFPGGFPIRKTLDHVGYRASDMIRAAARERQGGS